MAVVSESMRSTCCNAWTHPDANGRMTCAECGKSCELRLASARELLDRTAVPGECVTVRRELLIEAADQVEDDAALFEIARGVKQADGTRLYTPSNLVEYNRLTDLARRLREAGGE